jgi:5-methylphenazine-1-carboxylate 1-monooxygenase
MKLAIVGAGIGGLTLALELHDAGIDCEIYEAAPRLAPVGVGITSCRSTPG